VTNFISSAPPAHKVTAEILRHVVEYFEHLEAQKKTLADEQKELLTMAKANGYDTKVIRKVIAIRKRDAEDYAEESAVIEMYLEGLGM